MLPRAATAAELAVLHHPDRRSPWTVGLTIVSNASAGIDPEAIIRVVERAPVLGARWQHGRWIPGAPATLMRGSLDRLLRPFDLGQEPPLRVAVDEDGVRLHLAAHHAAVDGLGLLAVAASLLGLGPLAAPTEGRRSATATSLARTALRRLVRPATRVQPSHDRPQVDGRAATTVELEGPQVTARLAAAAAVAIDQRATRPAGARRTGISLGIGGEVDIGNTATYRRVDLHGPVEASTVLIAVDAALSCETVPVELRHPTPMLRLLSPIVDRLSDTFLVSNLGRHDLPGVERVEFYPVARGRSAVAFGAAGLVGRPSTVTIRARDLTQHDAEQLLDETVARLTEDGGG